LLLPHLSRWWQHIGKHRIRSYLPPTNINMCFLVFFLEAIGMATCKTLSFCIYDNFRAIGQNHSPSKFYILYFNCQGHRPLVVFCYENNASLELVQPKKWFQNELLHVAPLPLYITIFSLLNYKEILAYLPNKIYFNVHKWPKCPIMRKLLGT